MKNVASLFSGEALNELQKQLGIVLSDEHDYTEDELEELYEQITDGFPYEFDDDGRPRHLGRIFECIVDVFCNNGLVKVN